MRRYRTVPGDFDSRAMSLQDPGEAWEPLVKELYLKSRDSLIESLARSYGETQLDQKIRNFSDMGNKSMSAISFHNVFYMQVRNSFVIGSYYPALLGLCALTERTLNHLILELRDDFMDHPSTAEVAEGPSFSSWNKMCRVLREWGIITEEVSRKFKNIEKLRHRSVHFNMKTYVTVREDALSAIIDFNEILTMQFSTFGNQEWYIENTVGVCFIKKSFETNPFVKKFLIPSACLVGPWHSVTFGKNGEWIFVDYPPEFYGSGSLTDDEYRRAVESVTDDQRVKVDPAVPPS